MRGLAGRGVLVVGLGVSGAAAARALAAEGARVRVSEQREEVGERAELEAVGVEVLTGGHAPEHLDGMELVVTSPGVVQEAPILTWACERGLRIWSELELGARSCVVPYVAVTGTNGKSTTTEMVAAAMRAAGLDAAACGNTGYPFSRAAREGRDALVVEASSFQLTFVESLHPRVSVLLNFAPDHLDWHGSLSRYASAKARIYALQGEGDVHIGNADDPEAARVSREAPCRLAWFRLGAPEEGEVGFVGPNIVARIDGEATLGNPASSAAGFRADAAAAAAAALAFGLDAHAVSEGIASVEPLPHRGEMVAVAGAVSFIDDSKATNPHAALAALEGREGVVLIAGGLAKGVDLSPLAAVARRLKGVVAIGEAADEIGDVFQGAVPVRKSSSMEEAVGLAFELAGGQGCVLLAPACASQDMFADYADRGRQFAGAARRIAGAADD